MTSVIAWTAGSVPRGRANAVQQCRRSEHLGVTRLVQRTVPQGVGVDPDADRLGQDQGVAGLRPGIAADLLGPCGTNHGKAVDRFRGVDRVPAGDRNAGAGAGCRSACQDVACDLDRELAERHAEDRQGQDGCATHRIDVTDRIGRRDPSEIMRIVNDRHEKVGGGDDALVVAQLPDRRVVRRLGADEELREKRRGFPGQELLQDGRGQLAPAATAMGEFRQAKGRPSWERLFIGVPRNASVVDATLPRPPLLRHPGT